VTENEIAFSDGTTHSDFVTRIGAPHLAKAAALADKGVYHDSYCKMLIKVAAEEKRESAKDVDKNFGKSGIRKYYASQVAEFKRLIGDGMLKKQAAHITGLCYPHVSRILRAVEMHGIHAFVAERRDVATI